MRKACLAAACLFLALPAFAQTGTSKSTTSGQDRLFLTFAEEAAVVPHQWWEGQFEFRDGNPIDATILRGIVALKPWDNVEVGGRVGFGNTDSSNNLPDGSGATDLDVWGKFHFGSAGATEFAAGALVTVPTGDDSAGLGDDSFDLAGFGSVRYHTDQLILSGVAGIRFNGDGQMFGGDESPQGFDTQGNTSVLISGGALFPVSDVFTITGEAYFESERIEGADSDFRLGAGANWRPWNRGMLRGAVIVGLSDGAPDAQILASYAYTF